MRKLKILVAMFLLFSIPGLAQENQRLSGKIHAQNLEEQTVHIINKTKRTGTLNASSGTFSIEVRENDTLLFSSIQYNNLEIVINAEILKKNFLPVDLTEDVNQLAQVNLSNLSLTGNLDKDLANIKVVEDLPVNLNFRSLQKESLFESDRKEHAETPVNIALKQNQIGYGAEGLNILGGLGILADLAGMKSKPTPAYSPPTGRASSQIRKLFDDDFFMTSLGIREKNIQDFIFYLDDIGLSQQLFKPENRLALIEVLIDHSKIYQELFTSEN